MKIYYQNIANGTREDLSGWSLWKRLDKIIAACKANCPDIIVFTETGKPTLDADNNSISWTEIIPKIEQQTSTKCIASHRNNNSEMSLGITIFINTSVILVDNPIRHVLSGKKFGTIASEVSIAMPDNNVLTFVATHLSADADRRLKELERLLSMKADIIFGDFNAYPDENAEQMQQMILTAGLKFTSEKSWIGFPYGLLNKHPKITTYIDDVSDPNLCIAFTPLDYVVHCTDKFNININTIHPITNDIILPDTDPAQLLKEITLADNANPGVSRTSDHFALSIKIELISSSY